MGVSSWLAGWAALRPHVLLVPVPGATACRLAAEQAVQAAGGVLAASPPDADVLVVTGTPGDDLAAAIDVAWSQLPGPRSRAGVRDPEHAADSLRSAVEALSGPDQAADAAVRRDDWTPGDMADMPGGLMMTDRAPDRDGLALDALHVPLGPVLPDWPAGLVVDTVLQGDVIQQADARLLGPAAGAASTAFWHGPERQPAGRLDSLGRLLAIAGWDAAAAHARELRNALLRGTPPEQVRPGFAALRSRVERSRALRWSTEGLGVHEGVDATARWRGWLTDIEAGLAGEPVPADLPAEERLEVTTTLLPGEDLATARLVLASFDPDPDELISTAANEAVG